MIYYNLNDGPDSIYAMFDELNPLTSALGFTDSVHTIVNQTFILSLLKISTSTGTITQKERDFIEKRLDFPILTNSTLFSEIYNSVNDFNVDELIISAMKMFIAIDHLYYLSTDDDGTSLPETYYQLFRYITRSYIRQSTQNMQKKRKIYQHYIDLLKQTMDDAS